MTITGEMLIDGEAVTGNGDAFYALNPTTGAQMEPAFRSGGVTDVARACELGRQAFNLYRNTSLETRAALLESIASNLEAAGNELVERAMAETGLARPRLEGELARTARQLRMFAGVVRKGHWLNATLDSASGAAPDLRMRMIALGPVAVFGASNFPLAFSVAGGDTASALAAACPVIVKAHPAHPGTSEIAGRAIQAAVASAGLPHGVFSMLVDHGHAIGEELVRHSAIKAVGFTGSRSGGIALSRIAANRPEPIPVYAEMSSTNPVFLLPGALRAGGVQLATGFADSLTASAGQFCTNPGLVLAIAGADTDAWKLAVSAAIVGRPAATMLTPGIHAAYEAGIARLDGMHGVRRLAHGVTPASSCQARAALYETTADAFLADKQIQNEVFGPSSVIVICRDSAHMLAVAQALEGQLTATVHAELQVDAALAQLLLSCLELKAGRVLINGFPTGVEVCHAMVHGGPFPSTSDGRTTSVGAGAIDRFLRPVCYQNVPDSWLPEALQDANPLNLWRLKDGERVNG
ncbi:aldehyde dehydrogenase (NADP(+)) [Paraburkholderia agricolaris]|uniref:Aldehyde dehydrogenase (NADP(+)) n=1 Tax=Paraburkholderia agricolaris TaxID=2152888 RepID=A0ABW8ZXD0_9BURK